MFHHSHKKTSLKKTIVFSSLIMAPVFLVSSPSFASSPGEILYNKVTRAQPGETIVLPKDVTVLEKPLEVPRGIVLQGNPDGTILRIAKGHGEDFGYSFMIIPKTLKATDVVVKNISLDGSRSRGIPNNAGGGIKVGEGWLVKNVDASNMSYFRIWVYKTEDAKVVGNVFDDRFGISNGNDNMGGGRAKNITIAKNYFGQTARGNAIDLVAPRDVRITDNNIEGTLKREHSIFLEGPRGGLVSGNYLTNSSITIQDNARCRDRGETVNPADVIVEENTILNAPSHGIAIKYEDEGIRRVAGGNNTIKNNTIEDSGVSGIVLLHCTQGAGVFPDSVVGNSVTNAFARGSEDWGTGCGTVPSNGIAVTGGSANLSQNRITDTRSISHTEYGIYKGATNSPVQLGDIKIFNNTGIGLAIAVSN